MSGKSPVSASEDQRSALAALAGSRDRGEADRARAILLTLSGWTSPRIAAAFSVREDTVRLWRSDFSRGGIDTLKASVAPGPSPVKSETALRVVTPLLEEPVANRPNWTIARLRAENGTTVETLLEVVDGMAFDRGYLSHHMVTDVERMQVVLDAPYILMTDLKLMTQNEVAAIQSVIAGQDRPLLIIAEEVAPACVISLLSSHEKGGPTVAAIHPPDYGHWRKSMLDDIAIMTGRRVIARDLGGRIDHVTLRDLGAARQVRISANQTVISAGGGDPVAIGARREQVMRQVELSPPNIERDKLQERLARLAGGAAMILAGGATPVEQKRHAQLIEDAINAARSAAQDGIVAGGGTALLQIAPELDDLIASLSGNERIGAAMLRSALEHPLSAIAANTGRNADAVVERVKSADQGIGFDARNGQFIDMVAAGIVDPVAVSIAALRNAASVAALILTTQTLIAKKPDYADPTAGPALGGGAEKLGRA